MTDTGTVNGIEWEIFDLTKLIQEGFIPGFYYSVGSTEGEEPEADGIETITLEGPYATAPEAVAAAEQFILQGLDEALGATDDQ